MAELRWWKRRTRAPASDPGASMALLNEVLDRPLDPGYQTAAQKRVGQGLPASTSSRSPLLIVFSILVGFLATVAVLQLRTPDPAAAQTRADLIERIELASTHGDELVVELDALRAEVSVLEQSALGANAPTLDPLAEELQSASVAAGTVAMTGPGVRIELDDAPADFSEEGSAAENRVLAHDLQVLVNGLWASGAEAIAVNGQRLTTTSSIRYAGEAIVVDFRGLTRPYVIDAIGPVEAFEVELTRGRTGQYVANLTGTYGLVVSHAAQSELTVPSATRATTRVATVVQPEPQPELLDEHQEGADS